MTDLQNSAARGSVLGEREVILSAKDVSKKFCKKLRRSMAYGLTDLTKNLFGIKPDSAELRKEEFWALKDIDFELRRGEVLGLIGVNGSGKTTLLRLLSGIFPPDKGEIMIKGDNVMKGYYKAPDKTRESLEPDGWLHTGDLGYMDEDGFVFVTGRLKELIIKGGENIAPREIDEVLYKHPAVLDAAAVGIPDDTYGEEIMACVVVPEITAVRICAIPVINTVIICLDSIVDYIVEKNEIIV